MAEGSGAGGGRGAADRCEADLTNAIRAVEAQLGEPAERELDGRRATLLQRRAELAAQLRRRVEGG